MKNHENCAFDKCPITNGMCEKQCKCPNDGKAKLAGIACDKYKTKRFEKNLKKNGFVFERGKGNKLMDVIKVAVFPKDVKKLQTLIQKVEKSFK